MCKYVQVRVGLRLSRFIPILLSLWFYSLAASWASREDVVRTCKGTQTPLPWPSCRGEGGGGGGVDMASPFVITELITRIISGHTHPKYGIAFS